MSWVLPVAELVGLSAGDQGLCEVGTGLASGSSKHKRVQRLNLAERTAHWEVWSSAAVNSHRTGFVSCEEITKGNWKKVQTENTEKITNSDAEFLDTNKAKDVKGQPLFFQGSSLTGWRDTLQEGICRGCFLHNKEPLKSIYLKSVFKSFFPNPKVWTG